jgi:membrane-bound serine protease (ClpP class)
MLALLADGSSSDWIYSLALLVLGFVLVLIEIFVIPGLNIFGIIGFFAAAAGVAFAYLKMGSAAAAIVGIIALIGTAALIRLMLKMRGWQRLVLDSKMTRDGGYNSAKSGRDALLGQQGEALTPLRPAGRARLGEDAVDVVSQGGYVERGTTVEVVHVAGNRVVVQAATQQPIETSVEATEEGADTNEAQTEI